jgi:hypothetical protein
MFRTRSVQLESPHLEDSKDVAMEHTDLYRARETRFTEGITAFVERDFEALQDRMSADVTMHVPGSSGFAGTFRGPDAVGRCIVGLRRVFEAGTGKTAFVHDRDGMVVSHEISIHGAMHDVPMVVTFAIGYDADERVRTIAVEPQDLGLFDHVLRSSALGEPGPRST